MKKLVKYTSSGMKKTKIFVNESKTAKIKNLLEKNNTFIIIDENVFNIYQKDLKINLKKTIILKAGEEIKTLECYEKVIEKLLSSGIRRDSFLVAIGGGTIGDLAGFIGATLFRGIKYFLIPTTLLAMVDSAIGGKCGINFSNRKNILGSFFSPDEVYISEKFLKTLPLCEEQNGLAEIIKYGFIYNNKILDLINEGKNLQKLIPLCIKAKVKIISKDYLDKNLRMILNFGHTFGHAIEANSNFLISHGQAVLAGMEIALKIGIELSITKQACLDEFRKVCKTLALEINDYSLNDLFSFITYDKKFEENKINFILVKDFGKAIVKKLSLEELKKILLVIK